MKKVFYISLFLFVITILFLGVYNFAFKNNPNNPIADKSQQEESKKNIATTFLEKLTKPKSVIEKVTEEPAVGAAAVGDNILAFFSKDGKLKKITFGGGAEETIIDALPGTPLRAVWSPDYSKALVLLSKDDAQRWHSVDVVARSIVALKAEVSSPTFTNLSDRIFYLYTDTKTGKTALNSAKPDGSDWKEYIGVSDKGLYLSAVPKSASISFWNRPNAFEETRFFSFIPQGSAAKTIFSKKFGTNYLWSPEGDRFLMSAPSTKGGSDMRLGIANRDGGETRVLQIPTFIPKVAWSKDGKTIYYALPLSLPSDAVLPNDYYDKSLHSIDSFWKMDVDTARQERLIESADMEGKDYDSTEPFLSPKEDLLFFTNRTDGLVYKIAINQ